MPFCSHAAQEERRDVSKICVAMVETLVSLLAETEVEMGMGELESGTLSSSSWLSEAPVGSRLVAIAAALRVFCEAEPRLLAPHAVELAAALKHDGAGEWT